MGIQAADSVSSAPSLKLTIAPGPFRPTDDSLKQYQYPDWFRDAKFGIWSHWGPQAVPRQGDWYAKKMYVSDGGVDKKNGQPKGPDRDYTYHVEHYGPPSKFGYKDIIPLWKAEKWEPEKLMALYKKAGAKYFVSMGSHHDNFSLWNDKRHRWNAVKMGPQKDVVGLWQQAAKKEGLRFGVSEHLAASFTWFQTSHGADKEGPLKGVPYDGADPQYQDLYHPAAAPDDKSWLTKNPIWHQEWFDRIQGLIDQYHPDLLYSDSALPFGDVGRSLVAHYYNQSVAQVGKVDVVYNCKEVSQGRFAQDVERGVLDEISPEPWQTDTSIGDWYYRTGQKYKSTQEVLQMLVDIVSKNGNLLINIVQTPEGDLEPDMLKTLDEIGMWMAVNGEGIYGTRPWKVFGEKPLGPTPAQSEKGAEKKEAKSAMFNEGKKPYTSQDIRYTVSKDGLTLYAFCLGAVTEDLQLRSLGLKSTVSNQRAESVQLLGATEKLKWSQEADALRISKPPGAVNNLVTGFKIQFKP